MEAPLRPLPQLRICQCCGRACVDSVVRCCAGRAPSRSQHPTQRTPRCRQASTGGWAASQSGPPRRQTLQVGRPGFLQLPVGGGVLSCRCVGSGLSCMCKVGACSARAAWLPPAAGSCMSGWAVRAVWWGVAAAFWSRPCAGACNGQYPAFSPNTVTRPTVMLWFMVSMAADAWVANPLAAVCQQLMIGKQHAAPASSFLRDVESLHL